MSSISEPTRLSPKAAVHPVVQERLSKAVFWLISMAWRSTTENAHARASRYTGHLVIIALAVAAVLLSGMAPDLRRAVSIDFNQPVALAASALNQITPTPAASLGQRVDVALTNRGQVWRMSDVENLNRSAVPFTQIPSRLRRSVITYTVQPGDTVEGIAIMYNIKPETIMWSNPDVENDPDFLQIGQQLVVLPIDGVYHTVAKNDTLESIAKKYKAKIENITDVSFNNLPPPDYRIEVGMKLIVAGGEKPYIAKVVTAYSGTAPQGIKGTGRFQWPTSGTITQGYWFGHRALDIAAALGVPVYAADTGFVSFAGWTDVGYGRLVTIDHGNGFVTYYGHLSQINVVVGQAVRRGQLIGLMGSTGRSTGPHLHFEIRYGGALLNPGVYLP
jgi:murein DD-endopeptidase MepM/ murein hydrolase activator NlpD